MAPADIGTASDSSNIGSTFRCMIGATIGSLAGPEALEQAAVLYAPIGGAVAGTAK